jgi:hypothetical protein
MSETVSDDFENEFQFQLLRIAGGEQPGQRTVSRADVISITWEKAASSCWPPAVVNE